MSLTGLADQPTMFKEDPEWFFSHQNIFHAFMGKALKPYYECWPVRVDVGAGEGAWTRSHSAPGCGRIGTCVKIGERMNV